MKTLFPLLLTYALMTSQTFALSGGPVFGTNSVSVVGIYSGVLQGVTETSGASGGPTIPGDPLPPPDASTGTPSNAIGLFDLTVPKTSLATGTFMLFAEGTIFGGTIDASGDPDSGLIKGILQGSYNFNLTTFDAAGNAVTTAVTAQARGRVDAQVHNPTVHFSQTLGRLTGSADLSIDFGEINVTTLEPVVARTITFDVEGFKQSAG